VAVCDRIVGFVSTNTVYPGAGCSFLFLLGLFERIRRDDKGIFYVLDSKEMKQDNQ